MLAVAARPARYGVQGLACAYAVAYTVAAVLALVRLRRRVGGFDAGRRWSGVAPARDRRRPVAAAVVGCRAVRCRRDVGGAWRAVGRPSSLAVRRAGRAFGAVALGPPRLAELRPVAAAAARPPADRVGSAACSRRIKRWWKYLTAKLSGSFNEKADPKVQLEQAIIEAQEQHRRLKEQAANVIANQKQTEMRLNRAMEELEKVNGNARQAVLMADEATKKGDAAKAARVHAAPPSPSPTGSSQLESEVEELKTLRLQATAGGRPGQGGGAAELARCCRRSWPSARSSWRSSTRPRCRSR